MQIQDQIRSAYDEFTKKQKEVANYFYAFPERTAMQTTVQIAQAVGVSETSVIRFAYALGYANFSDLQREMKGELISHRAEPMAEETKDDNRLKQMISEEIGVLKLMRESVDFTQLSTLVRKIRDADRVMIFGYYGEHTVSFQLYLLLDSLRPNVFYYRENNDGFRQMAELNERSLVLATAFYPYSEGTLELLREVKPKNTHIFTFTDTPINEIALASDEVMLLKVTSLPETGFNVMSPIMMLFYCLSAEYLEVDRLKALYRLEAIPNQMVQPGTVKKKYLKG